LLVLQTDDLEAQTQACTSGLGLVFAPTWLFQDQFRSGVLVKVAIDGLAERSKADIHVLRNAGAPTAAIKAVSEFLRQKITTQFGFEHLEAKAH
jgi:DNA-binding transcriptional LysR family regulator